MLIVVEPTKLAVAACRFGRGLFATAEIAAGTQILTFTGPVIGFQDALDKGSKEPNPLQIGVDRYIDLEPPGVFVNHSCTPNAGVMEDTLLVALRPISAGQEIFYDYSTTISEASWTMECDCQTPACRQIVEDFHTLPREVRQKYLDQRIVQMFIVRDPERRGSHVHGSF